jgi:hypothetical protein
MDPFTYFVAYARVAPLQLTFFGHPTSSGMPSIDYFLTSELIEPGLVVKPTDPSDSFGSGSGSGDAAAVVASGSGSGSGGAADGTASGEADMAAVGIGINGYGSSNGNGQHDLRPFYAEQLVEISGLGTYYYAAPNVNTVAALQPAAGWGRAVAFGYDKVSEGSAAMSFGDVLAGDMRSYVCPQSVYKLHPLVDEVFVRILQQVHTIFTSCSIVQQAYCWPRLSPLPLFFRVICT